LKSGDRILALILAGGMLLFAANVLLRRGILVSSEKNHSLEALVEQEGKLLRIIDLTKVRSSHIIKVENHEGHYNLLLVEPGRIRFIEADCPHKFCVASGWLHAPGDMALCLPHKLLIYLRENSAREESVDAMAH